MRDRLWPSLGSVPDTLEALQKAGIESNRLVGLKREFEETEEYLQASLDVKAWDASAVELDRIVGILERTEALVGPSPVRHPSVWRRSAVADALHNRFFDKQASRAVTTWRRMDVALREIAWARKARRDSDVRRQRLTQAVRGMAAPSRLRRAYRVGPVSRDTRREIERLFAEAAEAADYALAALDQRAWTAAETDLGRLDAALRALKHVVQREATVYLPESWPVRFPARLLTTATMRRELRTSSPESFDEELEAEESIAAMLAHIAAVKERSVDVG